MVRVFYKGSLYRMFLKGWWKKKAVGKRGVSAASTVLLMFSALGTQVRVSN